ncbi:MAG TPA: OB-fold nucleic acid binding domain-containing protein [Fredinandcohnia sp.]|nr:OB-fold nucleic acid binding domain-containing protein [Fredinandcohnia sp.]
MERLWVKDIQVGQAVAGIFLVARKQLAVGRTEKPFLRLTLQDRTGQVDARVWENAEEAAARFEEGDAIRLRGQVATFQGRPQVTIEELEKVEEEIDSAEFAYTPPAASAGKGGGEALVAQLREELSRVEDPHVRALLLSFVDDPEIASRLARAPAAKEIHHAYAGGLVEHILSCVRLARRLADHYPMADRDLLVAGAFLHDIGKIQELTWENGTIGYTDEGRLVGHLVITAQWIAERARVITGFPKELELHLTHLVLAHHGRLEYGSPKVPHTIEAFLVHALDEIDSRMNQMLGQMSRAPGEKWAEPQKHWERLLWKAPAPTEGGKAKGAPAKPRKKKKKRKEGTAPAAPAPAAEAKPSPARPARAEAPKRPAPPPKKEGPTLTFKPFSALTGQESEAAKAPEAEAPTPEAPEAPTLVPTAEVVAAEPTPEPSPAAEAEARPMAEEDGSAAAEAPADAAAAPSEGGSEAEESGASS